MDRCMTTACTPKYPRRLSHREILPSSLALYRDFPVPSPASQQLIRASTRRTTITTKFQVQNVLSSTAKRVYQKPSVTLQVRAPSSKLGLVHRARMSLLRPGCHTRPTSTFCICTGAVNKSSGSRGQTNPIDNVIP